jgi:succinyl-CoA synthetase beta subunit
VATTPEEAEAISREYGGTVVVKAQVHSGGRGKAGGVKLAKTPAEARENAARILGLAKRPEAIRRLAVDPRFGLLPHQAYWLANFLYDDPNVVKQATRIMEQLYRVFLESGASMAEINPLITTPDGQVKAIDAKLSVDDNELFRRPDVARYRDTEGEPPAETKAREAGLSFVKLDGSVGCCVNGAGLAMATMDLVKYYGGSPANFLDIGGSSNPDKVVAALEIISADPNVKSILFNIFGGITRCDDVARGIVEATRRINIPVPIVIRLTGTNEVEAVRILEGAGFSAYTSMDEVVEKAVSLAQAN